MPINARKPQPEHCLLCLLSPFLFTRITMTTVLCAHFVTFALGMHESTWSLERPSIGSKGHQPFEPMLGLSKEPGAGSEGAGTEGGIMGTSLTGTVNKLRATGAQVQLPQEHQEAICGNRLEEWCPTDGVEVQLVQLQYNNMRSNSSSTPK